jgi:hypothetical protein
MDCRMEMRRPAPHPSAARMEKKSPSRAGWRFEWRLGLAFFWLGLAFFGLGLAFFGLGPAISLNIQKKIITLVYMLK